MHEVLWFDVTDIIGLYRKFAKFFYWVITLFVE